MNERWIPGAAVTVCWLTTVLVWLVGVVRHHRRSTRLVPRHRACMSLLVLPLTVAWLVAGVLHIHRGSAIIHRPGWVTATAIAALPLFTAFTIWSRLSLGTMWMPTPALHDNHSLRDRGPYAITRHPIYTGILGMLLCTAWILGQGWLFALFAGATAGLLLKARAEEQLLLAAFPTQYALYRHRVPRLIPFPIRILRRRYFRRHRQPRANPEPPPK